VEFIAELIDEKSKLRLMPPVVLPATPARVCWRKRFEKRKGKKRFGFPWNTRVFFARVELLTCGISVWFGTS